MSAVAGAWVRLQSGSSAQRAEATGKEQEFLVAQKDMYGKMLSLGVQAPNAGGMVEVNSYARQLLALHMLDPEIQYYVWNRTSAKAVVDVRAVLAASPLTQTFGLPAAGMTAASYICDGAFWRVFFDANKMPPWTLDQVNNSVSLNADGSRPLAVLSKRPEPLYTAPMVKFYKKVRAFMAGDGRGKVYSSAFDVALRHDLVLLFFVGSCLVEKNGYDVVINSFYVGPLLDTDHKRMRMWRAIDKFKLSSAVPTTMVGFERVQYIEQVQRVWGAIVMLLNADKGEVWMPISAQVKVVYGAAAATAEGAPATGGGKARAASAASSSPDDFTDGNEGQDDQNDQGNSNDNTESDANGERGGDQTGQDGRGDETSAPPNDNAPPEPPMREAETVPLSAGGPPPPPPPPRQPVPGVPNSTPSAQVPEMVNQQAARMYQAKKSKAQWPAKMGASISEASGCPYHNQRDADYVGFCPVMCVEGRVSRFVNTHMRGKKGREANARADARKASQLSGNSAGAMATGLPNGDSANQSAQLMRANAQMGSMVASMARTQPDVQRLVMSELCTDERVRASAIEGRIKPLSSSNEVAELIRSSIPMQGATDGTTAGDLGAIDALASYGGWSREPVGSRVARFAAIYAAPKGQLHDTWKKCGYEQTTRARSAIEQWLEANPVPTLRDHQAVSEFILLGAKED